MIDQVIETIKSSFPVRRGGITASTQLRNLVRDSLDAVELVAVLTEEYRVRIDLNALDTIETVGDIARYLELHAGDLSDTDPLDAF